MGAGHCLARGGWLQVNLPSVEKFPLALVLSGINLWIKCREQRGVKRPHSYTALGLHPGMRGWRVNRRQEERQPKSGKPGWGRKTFLLDWNRQNSLEWKVLKFIRLFCLNLAHWWLCFLLPMEKQVFGLIYYIKKWHFLYGVCSLLLLKNGNYVETFIVYT